MKSFGILRTNPGLTTNVKVMVGSKYGLSLESIDSSPELSVSSFKKVEFNKFNFYDELIPHFYKGLPVDIAFKIKFEDDDTAMSKNFADQFEEIYQYGARNISDNKNYEEEYEYFAPLYIHRGSLPENFVIFRVDGPGIIDLNPGNFRDQILRKLKVVKVFDMKKTSPLGEWLHGNFVDNEFFPDYPLEFSYDRFEFTNWRGINYKNGGYVSSPFFMSNDLMSEKEIFEMERFIFDGYRRNAVVFPNIINFSFLFDDTPADTTSLRKWSINRYYGFYVDNMELVKTMSPYTPPALHSNVVILDGNILSSTFGDPFAEGWRSDTPYYVEYLGEYYRVEKYSVQLADSVKKVSSQNSTKSGKVSVSLVDIGDFSGDYVSDQKTSTFEDRWRIISTVDLSGKESEINKNVGYINPDGVLIASDLSYFTVDDFNRADVWMIEVDGKFHCLRLASDGGIVVNSDYGFEFDKNSFKYFINKFDPNYTKVVETLVDFNNPPVVFKIYRLNFTSVKDFDTRIVDTDASRFEYERDSEITKTDESKPYFVDLNSTTIPKLFDDFYLKDKVVRIPVSSEYTANQETFKLRNGDLSPIWRKNPVYCRWGFAGSVSASDYPYLINNSSVLEKFNRTANPFEAKPIRSERNLDYFYNIGSSTFSHVHQTLSIERQTLNGLDSKFEFSIPSYLGQISYISSTGSVPLDIDYFTTMFGMRSTYYSGTLSRNVKKYAEVQSGDSSTPNVALFRGIKFSLYDVRNIKIDNFNKIQSLNTINNDSFRDFKFSIILTDDDNGMRWQVIERWSLNKQYRAGQLVVHDDVVYEAVRDTVCNSPYVYVLRSFEIDGQNVSLNKIPSKMAAKVQSAPWNQLAYNNLDLAPGSSTSGQTLFYISMNTTSVDASNNTVSDFNPSGSNDWKFYSLNTGASKITDSKLKGVLWSPVDTYGLFSIVYRYGEYYLLTKQSVNIDFWNPAKAIYTTMDTTNTVDQDRFGYDVGNKVFYKGKFYVSNIEGNVYEPTDSASWTLVDDDYANFKWTTVSLWASNRQYGGSGSHTHVVYNNAIFVCTTATAIIPSGSTPTTSPLWTKIYDIEADTDKVYLTNDNPLIWHNNRYYLIKSNTGSRTLDNGIRIFINKKYKNVVVNIYVNDGTLSNIRNSDRDALYEDINTKLTAKNFIDSINDLSRKNGFSDYIKYYIIDELGSVSEYSYDKNFTSLPYIIKAETPREVSVYGDSIVFKPLTQAKLKPSKKLQNGRINELGELNYFNETHMATEITLNTEKPSNFVNYSSMSSNKKKSIYRFDGKYMPVFYEIELFNKDNGIDYKRIELVLDQSDDQYLNIDTSRYEQAVFGYVPKKSTVLVHKPSNFGTSLEYYSQISNIIEDNYPDVEFIYEIEKPKEITPNPAVRFEESTFRNLDGTWLDSSGNGFTAVIISSTSSPTFVQSDLYPGNYIDFFGTSTTKSLMQTSKISVNGNERTFEFLVNCSGVSGYRTFMGDGDFKFGFNRNRPYMRAPFLSSTNVVYGEANLQDDTWYHLVFRVSYNSVTGSKMQVFVNGVETTVSAAVANGDPNLAYTVSATTPTAIRQINGIFAIGGPNTYTSLSIPADVFSGAVSHISFYQRALTNEEILQNFINMHKTFVVKYTDELGDIKLEVSQSFPSLAMNISDDFDPLVPQYKLTYGATGGNPPYQFSLNNGAYFTPTVDQTIAKNSSTLVYVKDKYGLTGSGGYYTVNSGDIKYGVSGNFVY